MKKLILFVVPLIAAAMLFSGMGKKPVAEESSLSTPASSCCESTKDCKPGMKCEDCKVCAKDMKNCGKEGCTCKKMDMKCTDCKDCKACGKDMKNCGKEGCTCMKTGKKGMKCTDCKACGKDMKNCSKEGCTCKKQDMKGMHHGKMEGKVTENPSKLSVRKPTTEELGKEVTCPVMTNEKFKVSVATPVIDYKGKAYFMCCNGCPQKFMATPEKYVK